MQYDVWFRNLNALLRGCNLNYFTTLRFPSPFLGRFWFNCLCLCLCLFVFSLNLRLSPSFFFWVNLLLPFSYFNKGNLNCFIKYFRLPFRFRFRFPYYNRRSISYIVVCTFQFQSILEHCRL